jgi:hypothetical protein
MTSYLILAAAVATAVAAYWVARLRWEARPQVVRITCPRCGQKLRYGAGKEARTTTCPRCLGTCMLGGPGADRAPERDGRGTAQVRR